MNCSRESEGDLPSPPSTPPPLLSDTQILSLAQNGSIPLTLPPRLRNLYSDLNTAATKFFSLPHQTKTDLYGNVGGTELGYVAIPGEKEYISFRALSSHAAESELEQIVAAVWRETYTLLYRVLCDLARAMDIDHEAWDKVVDGISPMPVQLEDATPTFLRMFRYEPDDGIAESHTDLGLLTLCIGDGQGLQVKVRSDDGIGEEWREYEEPTLLVGKTLRVLSGGRIRGGVHRVIGNEEGRNSTVFALRPCTKHEVDLTAFLGGERQNMVQLGELWKKMWVGAFNVNAPRDVREKQKQRQRMLKDFGGEDLDAGSYDQTNTLAAITS